MTSTIKSAIQHHPRQFGLMRYVYPVVSRRSGGVSIGINLTPDGTCQFSCVYCQVLAEAGRSYKQFNETIDLQRLDDELRQVVTVVLNGSLFADGSLFAGIDRGIRLNDFAFSGDGEPTMSPMFTAAVERAAAVRTELCSDDVRLVLITNATRLCNADVVVGLERLTKSNGEIWAKLDAGTEHHYKYVSRSHVPFATIIKNITETAKHFPLVIQTCLFATNNESPDKKEIEAYIKQIKGIVANGGKILRLQLYTVARKTPEPQVTPLDNEVLDKIAEQVRNETGIKTEAFYSR
ncbi:MAG: radical SAM protein [Planctomycetaceae bacterium]|nr:radical SAM protein [Planctomycetaceae bacterium]